MGLGDVAIERVASIVNRRVSRRVTERNTAGSVVLSRNAVNRCVPRGCVIIVMLIAVFLVKL